MDAACAEYRAKFHVPTGEHSLVHAMIANLSAKPEMFGANGLLIAPLCRKDDFRRVVFTTADVAAHAAKRNAILREPSVAGDHVWFEVMFGLDTIITEIGKLIELGWVIPEGDGYVYHHKHDIDVQ